MALCDIQIPKPLYLLPEDKLNQEVVIPCLRESMYCDCMTAFFTSEALRELAPGLASFVAKDGSKLRLVVSPYLSKSDIGAILTGEEGNEEQLAKVLGVALDSIRIDEDMIVRHTLECLSYMIATKRIEFLVAIVPNGIFHVKIRIFSDDRDDVALHGSNNFTASAQGFNFEQVNVNWSWSHEANALQVLQRLKGEFDRVWNGQNPMVRLYRMPEAIRRRIVREYSVSRAPSPLESDAIVTESVAKREFSLPPGLNISTGDYSHQGDAVAAWEASGRRGILEMATGAGKTIAALVAAHRTFEMNQRVLIVVSAPYRPLVMQWEEEARHFGLVPKVVTDLSGRAAKTDLIRGAIRNIRFGFSGVECLITTHKGLCELMPVFDVDLRPIPAMLIADEVHNLGTPSFLKARPEGFTFRLGLSATPVRQYDEEGTAELRDYFGDIVYQFQLKDAIGKCLVPYEYFVHPVYLTAAETDKWMRLTNQLKFQNYQTSAKGDRSESGLSDIVRSLLLRRRRILEQAQNKLPTLRDKLKEHDLRELKYTLIYASDKGNSQIKDLNVMLADDLHLKTHQITQEETSNPKLTEALLKDFASGAGLQVLTAMRVLDEGVNIPEVTNAYILASTTVERQWIQRRGRVLRKSKRIAKDKAYIHDFLVVPPQDSDFCETDLVNLLRSELRRIMPFAGLSLNPAQALRPVEPIINRFM